jgi:hypothetical protein
MKIFLSEVPTNDKFIYKDQEMIKSNHNRGMIIKDQKITFVTLDKHVIVDWILPREE